MPDHVRKQLRDAFKAAVAAGAPTLKSVTGARPFDYNRSSLPAAQVSTPTSATQAQSYDGVRVRDVTVTVSLFSGDTEPEDGLDALAEQVEAAVYAAPGIEAICDQVNEASTAFNEGGGGEGTPSQLVIAFAARVIEED